MIDAADTSDPPTIYLGDRGYASYNDFAHVIEKGQFFVIRCTDKKTGAILGHPIDSEKEFDVHVDRILCRSMSRKKWFHPETPDIYRHICNKVPMDFISDENPEYGLSLRIVRIEIGEDVFENIITNLPDTEFSTEDFKDLYHLRWQVENAFRDTKYPLCLN